MVWSLGVISLLLLGSCAPVTRSSELSQASGSFVLSDPQINQGKSITVWTYKPRGVGPKALSPGKF